MSKWDKRGLPHKGWTAVDWEDLGDLVGECDMCGTGLRYKHTLYHPEANLRIGAGEVCASHLVEPYVLTACKKRTKREIRENKKRLTNALQGITKERKSMALVTPNMDELASITPGSYKVSIVECEVKESKKGNQYLKWKFETIDCDEPKNNGQNIWTNTMISGKGAFRFKDLYTAAVGEDFDAGEAFDTDMLMGKELVVGVVDGVDQNGNKSGYPEVKTFAPA